MAIHLSLYTVLYSFVSHKVFVLTQCNAETEVLRLNVMEEGGIPGNQQSIRGQVQGHGHGQVHGSHGHGQLGLGVGQQLALAPDVVGTDANALESVDLWNLG